MRLIVRTAGAPDALVGPVRQALRRVDPSLPLFDVQTFEQHIAFSFFLFEMAATLLGVFGATATLLAALGLYGVVAHSVGHADARDRRADVAGGDGRRTSGGWWCGRAWGWRASASRWASAAALASRGSFASQLLGVSPYDPASYAATAAVARCHDGAGLLPSRSHGPRG